MLYLNHSIFKASFFYDDLTLTNVVFESDKGGVDVIVCGDLTLTNVVFECFYHFHTDIVLQFNFNKCYI